MSGDREVRCRRCGDPVRVPAWIVETARNWMLAQHRRAERDSNAPVPEAVTTSELVCCDACTELEQREAAHEREQVVYTTQCYVANVKAGGRNPSELYWLRRNGYGAWVDSMLEADGAADARKQG